MNTLLVGRLRRQKTIVGFMDKLYRVSLPSWSKDHPPVEVSPHRAERSGISALFIGS